MSLLQTLVDFISSNPLSAVGVSLGSGVLLQRFAGVFGKLASLFSGLLSGGGSAVLTDDIKRIINDATSQNGQLLTDVLKALQDLASRLPAPTPPPKV